MVNPTGDSVRFDPSAIDFGAVLAIVPARAGSKGLPGKNIAPLGGAPLVAWPIASALAAASVDRVIVTTDGEAIASAAAEYGAEVPFLRPASLAADDTTDEPVVHHTLRWLLEEEGRVPEIVVQLRPTTPFRPSGLIDDAVALLRSSAAIDCVRGVTPTPHTPYKMWSIDDGSGQLLPLLLAEGVAEPYNAPRQILPPVYLQTGHVDVFRSSMVLTRRTLTGERVAPVMVDRAYCVDIDCGDDLAVAHDALSSRELRIDRPHSPINFSESERAA